MASGSSRNIDYATVAGFGDEWERFDQTGLPDEERDRWFDSYFSVFPWESLPANAQGFDLGCGSGRWAARVAPTVGILHCVDPSSALEVAKRNLSTHENCRFHKADVDHLPFDDDSMDFGYSLGVLHHIPDTEAAMKSCVSKLKTSAPFLVYLYYSFENRPIWFRTLWRCSEVLRKIVSKSPHGLRYILSQIIAGLVYWPLARFAWFCEKLSINVKNFPLTVYRNGSFYTMRTDALDRFGTQLEQRFSRKEIQTMMENAGLHSIRFSTAEPFWCAVGIRGDFKQSRETAHKLSGNHG